jgi:cell volume regulation protein A
MIADYLTIIGILLIAAILLSRASARFGVPALLAFVGLGMLAGEDGLGRFVFSDYRLTFDFGIVTLILILFDGGFNTPLSRVREALVPALILATAGVVCTAALVGLAVHMLFSLNWTAALLVGAIISPTDAAVVFSVLGRAGLQLKKRVGMTLELESGLNDPMAVLLVAMLTQSIVDNQSINLATAALDIGKALAIGAAMGAIFGWMSWKLLLIARPPASALFPVLTIAAALLSFGATTLVGGSGFVATYVMAIILGNMDIPYRSGIRRMHDSLTWLAQLLMFLLLGLLVTPSTGIHMALPGLVVAGAALIARPMVALICLAPVRMRVREIAYIGTVGLRGAVPIILAIYPVMMRAAGGRQIFDLVFFAVLVNTIFPGAVAGVLARKLRLGDDQPPTPPAMLEIVSARRLRGGEFMAFTVEPASAVCGARVREIPMPPDASILLLIRNDEVFAPNGDAILGEGDHVYVFYKPTDSAFIHLIFGLPEPE